MCRTFPRCSTSHRRKHCDVRASHRKRPGVDSSLPKSRGGPRRSRGSGVALRLPSFGRECAWELELRCAGDRSRESRVRDDRTVCFKIRSAKSGHKSNPGRIGISGRVRGGWGGGRMEPLRPIYRPIAPANRQDRQSFRDFFRSDFYGAPSGRRAERWNSTDSARASR